MAKSADDIVKAMFSREALPFYLWLYLYKTQSIQVVYRKMAKRRKAAKKELDVMQIPSNDE